MIWKIVGVSNASVLYVYIDYVSIKFLKCRDWFRSEQGLEDKKCILAK